MTEFKIPQVLLSLGLAVVVSALVGGVVQLTKDSQAKKEKEKVLETIPVPSTN